jgi:UDP-glucose 4-epimerase
VIYTGVEVLITGGLGFLGSNLAIRLVELGAKVTIVDALVHGCGGNLHNLAPVADRVRVIQCDIDKVRRFRKVIRSAKLIFNLAGEISHIHSMDFPERDAHLNAWAQLRFLEECSRTAPGVRIIYAGTRQIYGAPRYLPVDEDHPISPVDFNGVHNYAATMYHLLYARMGKLDAVVLNLTNLYGPRMALARPCQGFLGNFVRKLITGSRLEVFGDGAQLRDPLHVDDAVEAFIRVASNVRPAAPMYNVGGPEPLTLGCIASIASRIGALEAPLYRPFPAEQKLIDIGSYYADWSRIHKEMEWIPRIRFQDGIESTLRFYDGQRQHYLDPGVINPPCVLRTPVPEKRNAIVA